MSDKTKLEMELEQINRQGRGKILNDLPLIILIIAMLAGWLFFIAGHFSHNATKKQLAEMTVKYEDLKQQIENPIPKREHQPAKKGR
ncbi:MAG: hypothetical protein HQL01_09160 [Nitrospirae bacterium]|nr:hypothetical protein [Nitrospirota bacterium]